jgi:hypothetical protein
LVPGFGLDQSTAFEIVDQFSNSASDEAGRKLLRRFPESGSDLLNRPASTISLE